MQEKKTSIPWYFYMLVGGMTAAISLKLYDKLKVFFYFGLLLFLVGLGKLIFQYITRGKEEELDSNKMASRALGGKKAGLETPTNQTSGQENSKMHNGALICNRCMAKNHPMSNFCAHCGLKLK